MDGRGARASVVGGENCEAGAICESKCSGRARRAKRNGDIMDMLMEQNNSLGTARKHMPHLIAGDMLNSQLMFRLWGYGLEYEIDARFHATMDPTHDRLHQCRPCCRNEIIISAWAYQALQL